ncbi:MerR family DNA-binding transcriptional regulator [Staphylococcus saprophyticus]|nr:MerR family DNA-binding transcriptional regulator [Staphylococcus saprophyticus]MDW4479872.1 MerR family DNA-binding transcriptional regulator [Staphylococcus saprophyticus]
MSQYQTGELAKLKNVSVRTIQYYDRKGLLKTVQTAKNGRRIFDEQSKQDLEIILILKVLISP